MLKSSDFFWNVLWLVAEFLDLAPADFFKTQKYCDDILYKNIVKKNLTQTLFRDQLCLNS